MLTSWKESYDQLRQSIRKQRHYFVNKGLVKAIIFPVVMYGCECWTIKKAWEKKNKERKLNTVELMLLICSVGEDT